MQPYAVTLPKGCTKFYSKVIGAKDVIMQGTTVAIDPSSGSRESQPGYAVCRAGVLVESGTLQIPYTLTIEGRLRVLYDKLVALGPVDVLVVEEIKMGMRHHQYLDYAVGVALAAVRAPIYVSIPIVAWKALARVDPRYSKGDQADAEIMAATVIHIAKYGTS